MANLSPNFTLIEMISSDRAKKLGIPNIPDDAHVMNLISLCQDLLEPMRAIIGMPMKINSGYRSPEVNTAVGGVWNSAHLDGRAADFVVPSMDLNQAWGMLVLKKDELPFDQLIWETNRLGSQWIHAAIAKQGETPRKEVLYLQQRPNRKYVS